MGLFDKIKSYFIGQRKDADQSIGALPRLSSAAPSANHSIERRSTQIAKPKIKGCVCGCKGKPLTNCPAGSVDYAKYKTCPARWARKNRARTNSQTARKSKQSMESDQNAIKQKLQNRTFSGAVRTNGTTSSFSSDLIEFAARHKIAHEKFFDAAGMTRSVYIREMEINGAIIAYNVTPCQKFGHSIRNRYGSCVVCDPKQLAFSERASKSGFVYAMFSPSTNLIKVGFTNNVQKRDYSLVFQKYAGINDWVHFHARESKDAGRIEITAHKRLAKYKVSDLNYEWDGGFQQAKEVYKCSKSEAISAIEFWREDKVSTPNSPSEKKTEATVSIRTPLKKDGERKIYNCSHCNSTSEHVYVARLDRWRCLLCSHERTH